uniref:Cyclin-dependent kinase inhibitor domain-containing protein n=1 Tax=Eptatretus burgeri TaxID=7764 RepID=A0A8C4X1K3_EPTBU
MPSSTSYNQCTSSPSDTTPLPPRRCLFGRLQEGAAFRLECSTELQAALVEASHRWDFDFNLGVPLSDGQERSFVWEAIPMHTVPPFYRERGSEDPPVRKICKVKRSSALQLLREASRAPDLRSTTPTPSVTSDGQHDQKVPGKGRTLSEIQNLPRKRTAQSPNPSSDKAGAKGGERRQASMSEFFAVKKSCSAQLGVGDLTCEVSHDQVKGTTPSPHLHLSRSVNCTNSIL